MINTISYCDKQDRKKQDKNGYVRGAHLVC